MVEADCSTFASGQFQPEQRDAAEGLMLWTSPDSMRICREAGQDVAPLRVLLAEDHPIDQISIRRLLEKRGIEVSLAGDGRKAIEMYAGGLFDLVLLDVLMPVKDGFEVAVYIREHEKTSGGHIPIIALTAYSLKAVYNKCRSVGMNGYLSKPVASSALRALCSVLLPDQPGC